MSKKQKQTKKTETKTTKRVQEQLDKCLPTAEQLNAGIKVGWPKGANAVKVTLKDGKTTVAIKGNEDTLKGTGITAVEFGKVPNDSKGHPMRDKFTADLPATASKVPKVVKVTAQPPVCGYPAGTLRAVIATEGLKGWKDDKALVEAVRKTLPKFTADQVARCLKLVSDPKHAFNGGNTEVRTGSDGVKRIVALKPAAVTTASTPSTAAPATK